MTILVVNKKKEMILWIKKSIKKSLNSQHILDDTGGQLMVQLQVKMCLDLMRQIISASLNEPEQLKHYLKKWQKINNLLRHIGVRCERQSLLGQQYLTNLQNTFLIL